MPREEEGKGKGRAYSLVSKVLGTLGSSGYGSTPFPGALLAGFESANTGTFT